MDKTASKPMPCPFCGKAPKVFNEVYVGCINEDCSLGCGGPYGAIPITHEEWNRRSPSEPQASVREQEPVADYHGMEYPLEQLPTVWLALAEELRGYARELENEPEHAIRFRQRAISIIACAEQLKWSLAHPAQPPAQVDAEAALTEIEKQAVSAYLRPQVEIEKMALEILAQFADANAFSVGPERKKRIIAIIRKHTLAAGQREMNSEEIDGIAQQILKLRQDYVLPGCYTDMELKAIGLRVAALKSSGGGE